MNQGFETPTEEPKKKSNTLTIIIIVVLVLLCCSCAALVALYYTGDSILQFLQSQGLGFARTLYMI